MPVVTGGAVLARALKSAGADTIFWLLAGPMQGVICECLRLGMKLVDARDERAAAMMAHAYSRVTGKTGVFVTGSGPAVTNTVTGVAVAYDDCAPVVGIGGSSTLASRGKGVFQEMDQVALMQPITKRAWQVQTPQRIPALVDMAFREANASKPGPVYLDLPADVLYADVDDSRIELISPSSNTGKPRGDESLIKQAIEVLKKAERPLIIAGSGAMWAEAGDELRQFVDYSQIPFFTTPLAKGLVPEDHPLFFPFARSFAWSETDVVLLVGTRLNYIINHLEPPRFSRLSRLIMVNIDASEIGRNRYVDVGIVGDAKAIMGQLANQACRGLAGGSEAQRAWVVKLKETNAQRMVEMTPMLNSDEKPIHPLRLCREIRGFLKRDAILVVDGQETLGFARHSIPSYYPRHRLNPGVSGCVGVGVPFAVGAKIARPEKQVLLFSGDGAFGYNCMELDTASRHKAGVVVVINNNGGWTGLPCTWPTGRNLGFTRYDKIAETLGGAGYYVTEPQEIRPALESAFGSGKPSVINVITSPVKVSQLPFTSYGSTL